MQHEYLKTVLLPRLLKNKAPGETLRIWVPACCSGEEAYSIAMMLLEIQGNKTMNIPVQIFATDLSEQAIAKARIGEYSSHDIKSVSPRRLQRFFTKTDGKYRIAKSVRSMCVFAAHNLLSNSPYSRIDFISCCNLLIYLDITAQKKAMAIFHYALNDNGYLMLGKSETIGTSTQLFSHFSNKFKIYLRKKETGLRKIPQIAMRSELPAFNEKIINKLVNKNIDVNVNSLDQSINSVLLSDFIPACVIINHGMEVLQFRGSTSLYLEHASGKASFDILKMVRPEIALELRTAIDKAIKTKERVRRSGIEMNINSTLRIISLEVVPLKKVWDEPLLLILFTQPERLEIYSNDSKAGKIISGAKDRRIKKLEEELAAARADMYAFAQEQDLAKQELQSASEEVVSNNEELQSMNEELETSQEEIESANEELITTNQELQMRNELQAETHQYAEAIVATMHEPMIILNKDLLVKSANTSFYKKFGFKEKEIEGRVLFEIGNKQWNIPRLKKLLENIIEKKLQVHNIEITHSFPGIGKRIMRINANHIIQKNHHEQFILLAIDDITASEALRLKEKEFFIKDIRDSNIHNAALKKAVQESTSELQRLNESLGEKNIQLESRNDELASFTFLTSHDLQEPLRKIQVCGTAIVTKEYQNLSDSGKDFFNRMQDAAKRMQKLIEDLLAYAHTTAVERKFENIDLNQIVEEVKTELSDIIQEKHANIITSKLGAANIIPFQFRQLMHNLISNSLKFSNPENPPQIIIKSRIIDGSELNNKKLLPHKKYCHITVTDNGIGFEPQFSERIFGAFQKLHSKDEFAGTGIGLAIAKKVVDNHNGIITATSQLNKGTSFDIYIPV